MKYKDSLKRLKDHYKFLSDLQDNIPLVLMVIDSNTAIRYINPAFEKQIGYPLDELAGRRAPYPWWGKKAPKRTMNKLMACLKKGTTKLEMPFITAGGKQKWFEVSCQSLSSSNRNRYTLISAWDVTEVRELRDDMQSYIKRITKLRETEHEHIAQKLHEDILQTLAALNLSIESVIKTNTQKPANLIPRLGELQGTITEIINEIRHLSHILKSGVLNHLGMVGALETLVDELNAEERVQVHFCTAGAERFLSSTIETTLYLIAQEALRNAEKHSQASQINVNLCFNPQKVKLNIADNGKGFEVPEKLLHFANLGKIGLVNMENWTLLLGGKIQVKSRLNRGTTISVEVKA